LLRLAPEEDPAQRFGVGIVGAAHGRQLMAILAAFADGREPPMPGEVGRKAVVIIYGISGAARKGGRVSLSVEGGGSRVEG
jgi:hypothetical protein